MVASGRSIALFGGAVVVAAFFLVARISRRRRIRVHLLQGGNDGGKTVKGFHLSAENASQLTSRVSSHAESISITFGPDPPPGTQVLVGSSPSSDQLQCVCGDLHALVVPFAGVPPETRSLLLATPGLRHVAVYSVHHNAAATAEMAIALLLAASKNILPADTLLRENDWSARGLPNSGTPDGLPLMLLQGKTALVLGLGEVGRRVSTVLLSLGVQVMATRASCKRRHTSGGVQVHPSGVLHELLPRTHILIICLPQTADTLGMIGTSELVLMPKNSILVNVGRGAVVDEDALYEALSGRTLGGPASAGLDCWWRYPTDVSVRGSTPPSNRDFARLPNVVMSPHRGGGVGIPEIEEARMEHLASLLIALAEGSRNVPGWVDLEKGY